MQTYETVIVICGKRIRIDLPKIGITIYTLFIITQLWLARFEEIRAILHISVVFLALSFLLLENFKGLKIKNNQTIIDLFWFLAYTVIVFYILLAGFVAYTFDLFIFTTGILFLFFAKASFNSYLPAITLLKIAAIVFASGSILQYLFTDSFNRYLFKFVSTPSQLLITQLVINDYYPGFGFYAPASSAAYMVMGLGIVVVFWILESKKRVMIIDGFLIVLLIIGLLATGKRSILLWALAAVIISYFALELRIKKQQRILLVSLSIAFLVLLLFILPTIFDGVPLLSRFSLVMMDFKAGEASGSIALRFRHYQDAWKLFIENPLSGVGWRQFIVLTSGFYPVDYSVHNVYLQLLCEMGIFGFFIIITPLIYAYLKTHKVLKKVLIEPSKFNSLWKEGLAISFYFQTFFLLYCLTENPFYNLIYLLLYFLAISILNSFIVLEKDRSVLKG